MNTSCCTMLPYAWLLPKALLARNADVNVCDAWVVALLIVLLAPAPRTAQHSTSSSTAWGIAKWLCFVIMLGTLAINKRQ